MNYPYKVFTLYTETGYETEKKYYVINVVTKQIKHKYRTEEYAKTMCDKENTSASSKDGTQ